MAKHGANGQLITPQEATISTAQVEIQVLRVGHKHVTQAMFRQLPYREIVDWWRFAWKPEDEVPLEGRPWGYVNYWWAGNDLENTTYLDSLGICILCD